MYIIHLTSRPERGKIARVCQGCGVEYVGWNVGICLDCEIEGVYLVSHDYA